jgi:CRISPR-associated protein Csm1
MEKRELLILVLAALLHDVGKFAQRVGAGKSQEMEGEYCPNNNDALVKKLTRLEA